jgi:hypothetical protein
MRANNLLARIFSVVLPWNQILRASGAEELMLRCGIFR